MVVHASPDAPGVDLLVDGAVVGTNLTFPNNTSTSSSRRDAQHQGERHRNSTTVIDAAPPDRRRQLQRLRL